MAKRLLKFLRTFLPVKKLSQIGQEKTYYNLTTERLETIIEKTLKELKLNEIWYGKKISEVSKLDIEYLIALINSRIEKYKAIQVTVLFFSLFITFFVNFIIELLELKIDKATTFLIFAMAIFIVAPYFERNFKNNLENFTYLKEILTIYKNHKNF